MDVLDSNYAMDAMDTMDTIEKMDSLGAMDVVDAKDAMDSMDNGRNGCNGCNGCKDDFLNSFPKWGTKPASRFLNQMKTPFKSFKTLPYFLNILPKFSFFMYPSLIE